MPSLRPTLGFGRIRRQLTTAAVAAATAWSLWLPSARAAAPDPPGITEPSADGVIVNPADVHMETAPFSDPDPGDTHLCTDWEIRTVTPDAVVWESPCIGGVERVHVHLGDGSFVGAYAGRSELEFEFDYVLRVRHRDGGGLGSAWAVRSFTTGAATEVFPLELDDVATAPTPQLVDETAATVVLPAGAPPASIRLDSPTGGLLLRLQGLDGGVNAMENPASLGAHVPVRAVIEAGDSGVALPATELTFTDHDGLDHTVYLPAVNLPAGATAFYWISEGGSSYVGNDAQIAPDFSTLAQGAPVPWAARQPGYRVEIVARGLQLPVNLAFKPNAGTQPDDPWLYVTELYGAIKVIARNGTVSDYASDLLNFNPTASFPGSGEQGLAGIAIDAATGDVFAGMLYDSAPPDGPHYPKVVRFFSADGGRTASGSTVILDMPGETQGQSHFISNLTIGPDGKLYVHMGDGFAAGTALNLDSYRGKILRLELDGSAPTDNPYYSAANGITARDYVFAYGFRNPFGGAWRAADGFHYEVENGSDRNDRLAKVTRGGNYGWDGTPASMTTWASYNWTPTHAPVNIVFLEPGVFGGSGFPDEKLDHAFVTESGPTWATGPQTRGKRIVEFTLDGAGLLVEGPTPLVEYNGAGKATAVGLAVGPDGLYFTDLYKDLGYATPIDRGANVLRVRFVGTADFSAVNSIGPAPRVVQFTDQSNVPSPTAWHWDFGDGQTSTVHNPLHVYTADGTYDVRLAVTGANGAAAAKKHSFVIVGNLTHGLRADYYDDRAFSGELLSRIDTTVDFDWGNGAPDPGMGGDDFSVRWTGQVEPQYSQTYTFIARVDDGVRLWIDEQLVIDSWIDQPPTEHSGTIALQAGVRYDLRLEFYERGGGAVCQLSWQSPSQSRQIVPQSRLYPGIEQVTGAPAGPALTRPFALGQNRPNPFNPATRIGFTLPAASAVDLFVYDLRGREVARLLDGRRFDAGTHDVAWHGLDGQGRAVASGSYVYRMSAVPLDGSPAFSQSRKLAVVR